MEARSICSQNIERAGECRAMLLAWTVDRLRLPRADRLADNGLMDLSEEQFKIDTNVPRRRRPFQFGLMTMFVVTALVAACCSLLQLFIRNMPKDLSGTVLSVADWPYDLRDLLTAAEKDEIPIESVQVFAYTNTGMRSTIGS